MTLAAAARAVRNAAARVAQTERAAPRRSLATARTSEPPATSTGWKVGARKDPLTLSPRAFDAFAVRATVPELVRVRDRLDPLYKTARLDETKPANRAVIRQWDVVDQAILRKSGPSGGE